MPTTNFCEDWRHGEDLNKFVCKRIKKLGIGSEIFTPTGSHTKEYFNLFCKMFNLKMPISFVKTVKANI